ncbi:MAG TPA: hypothetical protein VFE37_26555 [Chloroflexota bacterium]|nr:hypothetical protein [Chloroflexota bacterium]
MPIRKPSMPPVPPTPEQRERVREMLAEAKGPGAPGPRETADSEEKSMAQADRSSFWHEVATGLRHLFGNNWPGEDRTFAGLLDVLVRGKKLQDDLVTTEADAPAVSTRDPRAEEAQLARQELDRARADLPDFERALQDAWKRSRGTTQEVLYSSTDPRQDRAADVLIRYLVTTDVASVRSEQTGPEQYRYYLSVDWTTLLALAEHLGLPLRRALDSGSGD